MEEKMQQGKDSTYRKNHSADYSEEDNMTQGNQQESHSGNMAGRSSDEETQGDQSTSRSDSDI